MEGQVDCKCRQAALRINSINSALNEREELLCLNKGLEKWVLATASLSELQDQGLGSSQGGDVATDVSHQPTNLLNK